MAATLTAPAAHLGWTIAYRKPRANKFHRAILPTTVVLTKGQAVDLGEAVVKANPGLEVHVVPTLTAEQAGAVHERERGNILVRTGRRIPITETGDLTTLGVQVPGDLVLAFDRVVVLTAEVVDRHRAYADALNWTGPDSLETVMARNSLLDATDYRDLAVEFARDLRKLRTTF